MDNTEANLLIAEFMGNKLTLREDSTECYDLEGSWDIIHKDDLCVENAVFSYGTSWNVLMPVVRAIGPKSSEDTLELIKALEYGLINASIGNVYEAVVEFIKWYNENK